MKKEKKKIPNDVLLRLTKEKEDLGAKICGLTNALYSPLTPVAPSATQRLLMQKQLEAMQKYHDVLCTRLADAKSADSEIMSFIIETSGFNPITIED